MNFKTISLTFLLFSTTLIAFQDYDIDGVEDHLDQCPNTPFTTLVDSRGCGQNEKATSPTKQDSYWGELTFGANGIFRTDESYENDNTVNLYANYQYHNWNLSLSNSRSTTTSSYSEDNSINDNDIYLATGYTFHADDLATKVSVGTKLVNDDPQTTTVTTTTNGRGRNPFSIQSSTVEEIATRDNDYFASLNLNYLLSDHQDLFLYYGYTFSGDSSDMNYEDYSSFSIGTGYALTQHWYSALSYNYTGSIYSDGDAEQSLSWFNSYYFTKNFFSTMNYTYALTDVSYDHTFSLGVGVHFK